VQAASLATRVPLGFGGHSASSATIEGYTPAPNEEVVLAFNRIAPDYFKTMGIPLIAGREFTDLDTTERPDVTIVNETLARRALAGRDPIGGRIRIGRRTAQIIGVARDGKYSNITEAPRPFMYVSVQQMYRADAVLHVKTGADPGVIVPRL